MSMFVEKRVQKFTYNALVDSVTKNTSVTIGYLPANALIVNGYAKVTVAFTDSDAGNDTTVSLGYTSAVAAFYPATACSALTDNVVLKLIPGVINIGAAEAITTVDTPAEIVAVARVSGDTHSLINFTAGVAVLLSISNHKDLATGRIDVYIEYVMSE